MKYKRSDLFMTPEEAASIIGVSPNLIRLWLQQDKYDFGTYDKKVGAQAGSYTIFRHKFEKFAKNYCGIDIKKRHSSRPKQSSV